MSLEDMCKQFGILEKDIEEFLNPMLKSALIEINGELELTSKGKETLAKLWFTVENSEGKILSGFTPEEASIFIKQLYRIQEKCVKIMSTN